MNVSIVAPIYRTADCLEELHARLSAVLDEIPGEHEMLLIDDRSPDGAWDLLQRLAAVDTRVRAIRLSRNFGQHAAIAAGFDHARGDVTVLMDADLQDRPEDLPTLLAALGNGVEIVYTVRKGGQRDPFLTRLTSRIYYRVFSTVSGTHVPAAIGTYRAFSRRVSEALGKYHEHNVLFGPLMLHIGFEYATVPLARGARPRGRSAYTFTRRLGLAVNSIVSYTDLPQRAMMMLGLASIGGSALYLVALIGRYLSGAPAPAGLTLIMTFLTFALGVTMLGIGIIGTYVFRTYQETLARPRYLVDRAVNLHDRTGKEDSP